MGYETGRNNCNNLVFCDLDMPLVILVSHKYPTIWWRVFAAATALICLNDTLAVGTVVKKAAVVEVHTAVYTINMLNDRNFLHLVIPLYSHFSH